MPKHISIHSVFELLSNNKKAAENLEKVLDYASKNKKLSSCPHDCQGNQNKENSNGSDDIDNKKFKCLCGYLSQHLYLLIVYHDISVSDFEKLYNYLKKYTPYGTDLPQDLIHIACIQYKKNHLFEFIEKVSPINKNTVIMSLIRKNYSVYDYLKNKEELVKFDPKTVETFDIVRDMSNMKINKEKFEIVQGYMEKYGELDLQQFRGLCRELGPIRPEDIPEEEILKESSIVNK
jgi:hypothetical protein